MRFLVIILAVVVMTLAGCDLELGGSGDQYSATFDVSDNKGIVEEDVVYKSGDTAYGNIPVLKYSYTENESILIISMSSVTLNESGGVDGGVAGDISDYIYLTVSGTGDGVNLGANIDKTTVRYKGKDYIGPGNITSASITTDAVETGDSKVVKSGSFVVELYDLYKLQGTYSVLGIDLDGGDPDK